MNVFTNTTTNHDKTQTTMDAQIVNKIPVSTLFPDRYGLGKTKVYELLDDLQIKPFKEGKFSFITIEQLHLLDEYSKVAADKDAASLFLEGVRDREHVPEHVNGKLAERVPEHDRFIGSLPDWALMLAQALAPKLGDPLAPQRQLEEIAAHGWGVTTSQLRSILGYLPSEGDRLGFKLTKIGRQGREMAWKVEKASGR